MEPNSDYEFLVTVDLSQVYYNKATHKYMYQLPTPILFDHNKNWTVSLSGISLSPSYENVSNCSLTLLKGPNPAAPTETKTLKIPNRIFMNINKLVLYVGSMFASQECRTFCATGGDPPYLIGYDDKENRVLLQEHKSLPANIHLMINNPLARKLGVEPKILTQFPYRAPSKPDINFNCQHIFVYSDIVPSTIVNQTTEPLLGWYAMLLDTKTMANYEYPYWISNRKFKYLDFPHFQPVNKSPVNLISFWFKHETGSFVEWHPRSCIVLTLNFKRQLSIF